MSKTKRDSQKPSEQVNYSLFNQKITFEFLKSHLWSAADILRGSLDPSDYRQPIMTILFLKRLNDTFEENAEKLIQQGKSQKEAFENANRHNFFIRKDARWSVLASASEESSCSHNQTAGYLDGGIICLPQDQKLIKKYLDGHTDRYDKIILWKRAGCDLAHPLVL